MSALKNGLDYGVPDGVEQPEIGARDDHEPERHRRALAHLAAVRPLDAAQLVIGRAQEVGGAAEQALTRGMLRMALLTGRALLGRAARNGAGLGEVRLRHVGHRLPERVRGLGRTEVSLVVVIADAIGVAEGLGVWVTPAARTVGSHLAVLSLNASRDARYAAGTTCSTCAG